VTGYSSFPSISRVTLIARMGARYDPGGPYNGAAAAADTTTLFESLAALRTEKEARLNQAGVIRSPSLILELETPGGAERRNRSGSWQELGNLCGTVIEAGCSSYMRRLAAVLLISRAAAPRCS
jgi:hypothetical protein